MVSALAWKADGGAALLRTSHFAACESQRFVSVVAEDKTKASRCYDLYGDPKKAVSCSRLRSNYGAKEKSPACALNSLGLRRHRKAKYARAAADFIYALERDPTNVMARYNDACALSRMGLLDRAISQLEAIRDARCGEKCHARLERAKVDEDLEDVRADPRFVKLTKTP